MAAPGLLAQRLLDGAPDFISNSLKIRACHYTRWCPSQRSHVPSLRGEPELLRRSSCVPRGTCSVRSVPHCGGDALCLGRCGISLTKFGTAWPLHLLILLCPEKRPRAHRRGGY